MNGAADSRVGAAAADVAGHRVIDIRVGGLGVLAQEHGGGHDLARLAIAALRNFLLDPGALQRMRQILRKALDCGHLLSDGSRDGRDARAHGFTINMDGASAALRHAATVFGSRELEAFADGPEERHRGIHINRGFFSVYRQRNHVGFLSELDFGLRIGLWSVAVELDAAKKAPSRATKMKLAPK
jgi:hypothetical protein